MRSIIERVADLLGPDARPDQDTTPASEHSAIPGHDFVERLVGESAFALEPSKPSGVRPKGDASYPEPQLRSSDASARSVPTRTLKLDLEKLGRQNLLLADERRTPVAEVFRRVKRRILVNLLDAKPGTRPNLVMVTSSLPGEGKSYCATNLALSLATEVDHTVLLVDGDVARPSIPQMLGVEADKGLMDVLVDRQTRLSDVLCGTNIGKLMLLQAGTANRRATEMLSSGAMGRLLKELSEQDTSRIVIFDSPPIMAASEASVLASQMGQVIVVVEAGNTTEMALKTALGRIETSNVVGLLLNRGRHAGLLDGYDEYGYDAT